MSSIIPANRGLVVSVQSVLKRLATCYCLDELRSSAFNISVRIDDCVYRMRVFFVHKRMKVRDENYWRPKLAPALHHVSSNFAVQSGYIQAIVCLITNGAEDEIKCVHGRIKESVRTRVDPLLHMVGILGQLVLHS